MSPHHLRRVALHLPARRSRQNVNLFLRESLVKYADFECSFCARFAQEIEPALRKDYIDRGACSWCSSTFPWRNINTLWIAAQAAWCAGRQSGFWKVHNRLFSLSGRLIGFNPEAIGKDIGLDMAAYNACRDGEQSAQAVRVDRHEGDRLMVSGAPRSFTGSVGPNRRIAVLEAIDGARPVEAYKAVFGRLSKLW